MKEAAADNISISSFDDVNQPAQYTIEEEDEDVSTTNCTESPLPKHRKLSLIPVFKNPINLSVNET